MESIHLRIIEPRDNKEIAQIIRSSLKEFGANHPGTVYYDSTTDDLYSLFKTEGSIYFIAEHVSLMCGGIGIFPSEGLEGDTCELVKFYLSPEYRGIGLGKRMMQQALDFAKKKGYKKVYLESMPELSNAVILYEKFGFEFLSKALGNTGHTSCSIWMLKEL
jgi:putative acetyltransferase